MATRMARLVVWTKNHEMELGFGFVFVGLHVIWWNLQKKVPPDERSELKAYYAVKKHLTERYFSNSVVKDQDKVAK